MPAGILLVLTIANMLRVKLGVLNSLWCLVFPLTVCFLIWYLMFWSLIDRVRIELLAVLRAAQRITGPLHRLPRSAENPA